MAVSVPGPGSLARGFSCRATARSRSLACRPTPDASRWLPGRIAWVHMHIADRLDFRCRSGAWAYLCAIWRARTGERSWSQR